MDRIHILLIACLAFSISEAGAAPKNPEAEAQAYYDRGMAVFEVDQEASMGLFTKAAKLGHVDAMVRLAHSYQSGAKPSYKYALQWYEKAAKAGNTAALFEIGSIYEKGLRSIKPDVAEAIEWYNAGVGNNSLKSCEGLARIYASSPNPDFHDGNKAVEYAAILVKKDPRNAAYMDLLAAAYARNDDFPNALKATSLAVNLSSLDEAPLRRERKEQYEQGMPYPAMASDAWILRAAEKENIWAVLQLASLRGDVFDELYDPAAARNWYEIAAENGNSEALLRLGRMCFRGEGGDVDMKKAFWCFSESAEKGNEQAYDPLARMYVGGKGVGKDLKKAEEWYQKAADAGQRNYGIELSTLKSVNRNSGTLSPEDLFEEAQRIISDDSPNKKGEIPTLAQKTQQIYPRYWLAAEQGNTDAMNALADLYFYGKRYFVREGAIDKMTGGINSNYAKAFDYYEQLTHRGIECPEMETCKELFLEELKDRRERQEKLKRDAERDIARAAAKLTEK